MRPLALGLEACRRRLDPGARAPLAVAFSGGGDSLALLLVALGTGRQLVALHVDHGLQPASAAWARDAQAVCERLGAPFHLLRWDGPKPDTGIPAAARAARHRLLADAARREGAQVLLVGHTLDDQLENVVMRGAGVPVGPLAEWSPSPMWPQGRGLFLLRPLLAVRRQALRDWMTDEGFSWLDDPANEDPRHPRIAARRAVQAGPGGEALAQADIASLAARCEVTPWGAVVIERQTLLAAPSAQALRLLQIAVACASGGKGLSRPQRAGGLLARLAAPGAFTATLGGARVTAGSTVRLSRESGEAARGGLAAIKLAPGVPAVWDGRFEVAPLEPGWRVQALRGYASCLSPADAARARAIPVHERPSLPCLRHGEGAGAIVRLALPGQGDHIGEAGGSVRLLVQGRLAGAAGLVTKEDEIGTIAHMANVSPPPYVGAEAKD